MLRILDFAYIIGGICVAAFLVFGIVKENFFSKK